MTRSKIRDHNNLVSKLVTVDEKSVEPKLGNLFQEAQAKAEAKVAASKARTDAKFQQLSQQIEALIRTAKCMKGVDVGDNSAVAAHRTNNAGEYSDLHLGRRNNINSGIDNSIEGRGIVSRYTKLDFPTYDGIEDPLIWLHRCEKFFTNQRTANQEKVGLASFRMVGEAQLWVYQLELEEHNLTWGVFKEYCTLRFGPPMKSNPLGEVVNLKKASNANQA